MSVYARPSCELLLWDTIAAHSLSKCFYQMTFISTWGAQEIESFCSISHIRHGEKIYITPKGAKTKKNYTKIPKLLWMFQFIMMEG